MPRVSAVRFAPTQPTNVKDQPPTHRRCPSGARSEVLAFATDVANADVLIVSRYGTTLASEVVNDDGTGVTVRCLIERANDQHHRRRDQGDDHRPQRACVVFLATATGYVYDTTDMSLPMGQVDTLGQRCRRLLA